MKEPDYKKITQVMKQARKENNYTQEQVANDLDCTPAFISNVENNRAKLNLRILSYYSQIFKIPMESLLAEHPESLKDTPIILPSEEEQLEKELLKIFKTYSAQERKKIIEMLKFWKSDSSNFF